MENQRRMTADTATFVRNPAMTHAVNGIKSVQSRAGATHSLRVFGLR